MAGNEEPTASFKSSTAPSRPIITLPPRGSFTEALFNNNNNNNNGSGSGLGWTFNPGPMTLVSNFFADSDNCKSFSQLLAGDMASPAAAVGQWRPSFSEQGERNSGDGGDGDVDFRFKQNRPAGLVIAQPPPIFAVPPGLSPATLIDSPNLGLFSPAQGPFGMTHQQALAQVTAQAAQAQSHTQFPTEYPSSLPSAPTTSLPSAPATSMTQVSSFTANTTTHQQVPPPMPDSSVEMKESSDFSHSDQRPQSSLYAVDKPADDPYNWRKYGQKHVKGSEFPRSYYKCTHPNCPVKKKVERSLDGQVAEIIYKGQHNHPPPQSNKRSKDAGSLNGNLNNQGGSELASQLKEGVGYSMPKKDQESSQVTPENISGTSDNEEVGDAETGVVEKDEDEPDAKRRSTEIRVSGATASHRTVTEPRIIVQTTSEVDLLDDGYRWRKYGQKVVKGNPYPRSYYKCTTPGCNVRKHVERASTDPKAVITTYEGKHSHDVPAAKNSSRKTSDSNASQIQCQDRIWEQ